MDTPEKTRNRLIKTKAAAEYLGISERKLWDLKKNGAIPVVKIDRSVRYDISDLDNFIEKAKDNNNG